MTGIGSIKQDGSVAAVSAVSPCAEARQQRAKAGWIDSLLSFLCSCLCTASRGYLCCPECDDARSAGGCGKQKDA